MIVAGVVGFEPTHDGFRDRSLTAWRYPIKFMLYSILKNPMLVKKIISVKLQKNPNLW